MTAIRDIQLIKQQQERKVEPNRPFEPGVLVFVDSTDANNTAMVNGRPEYVWYKTFNQPQAVGIILNRAVPSIAGQTVKIGYPEKPPFERQVLGLYDFSQVQDTDQTGGGSLITAPHAQSHQWPTPSTPGTDPVRLYQPALMPFKTEADGTSLLVLVNALPAYRYQEYIRAYPGGAIDMTPYVPSTVGMHRYVLIYLDVATMFIQLVLGAEGVTAVFPPEPKLPVGGIASAFVLLETGQTSISTEDDITDKRAFISAYTDANADGTAVFAWLWDDEAARLAETTVSQDDVDNHTIGLQLDEGTIWRAESVRPDWTQLSSGNSGYVYSDPGPDFVRSFKQDVLYKQSITHTDALWHTIYVDGVSELHTFDIYTDIILDIALMGQEVSPTNTFDWRVEGVGFTSLVGISGNITQVVRYAGRAGVEIQVFFELSIQGIVIQARDTTAAGTTIKYSGKMTVTNTKNL